MLMQLMRKMILLVQILKLYKRNVGDFYSGILLFQVPSVLHVHDSFRPPDHILRMLPHRPFHSLPLFLVLDRVTYGSVHQIHLLRPHIEPVAVNALSPV